MFEIHFHDMAKTEKKKDIELFVADVGPIALSCAPDEENEIREAEKLVNQTWKKWTRVFGANTAPHELLARVAFRFAWLYYRAATDNEAVDQVLAELEQRLDDNVLKH